MKRRFWTAAEVDELTRRYPHERTEDVARDIGRGLRTTYQKALALGLRKSPDYLGAAIKTAARALAFLAAAASGWRPGAVPKSDRLHLWIDFYPPTRRLPDDDNMLSRCKPYRDGIADALGIDDKRFVSHPYVRETPRKGGAVVFRLTGEPQA